MTDLDIPARAALTKAEISRWAMPETLPRLPKDRPEPLLPRHMGRYHGLLPDIDERTEMDETTGLVPGQHERVGASA